MCLQHTAPALRGGLLALLAAALFGLSTRLVQHFGQGLGAFATAALALAWGEPVPGLVPAVALLAIGATGYGLSLRLYLLAQHAFGAGRTGSVLAFAPFIGALGAIALSERPASAMMAVGGFLMLLGVLLHLAESHAHAHDHEAMEHEHAHRHDDGHHLHRH